MNTTAAPASELSVTDCYRKAWDRLWEGFVDLLLPLLAWMVIAGFGSWLGRRTGLIGVVFQLAVGLPVGLGATWVYLRAARGERPEIGDLFVAFRTNYTQAVVGMALVSAIVGLGMMLLVVPGVFALVRLCLVPYLLVAERHEPIAALRESWRRTEAHGWTLFGALLMTVPILLVGALLLGVGLMPAAIWIHLAFAQVYLEVTRLSPPAALSVGEATI